MDENRPPLSGAARAGLWLGAFGWLIGLCAVTGPDTLAFAGPLAGGASLTVACALAIEAIWRHAARPQLALPGAIWCAAAAVAAYYGLIVEPSVRAVPELVDRLAPYGVSFGLPPQWAAVALLVGLPLLLAGLPRSEPVAAE